MLADQRLNAADYLMRSFDHELRRRGFAGNSCQIVLELGAGISPNALQQRLETLAHHWPILSARPGGFVRPRWKFPRRVAPLQVRVHRHDPTLGLRIFNEPLATQRGELARFDLIERDRGRMDVLFTWTHALMDAPGAESLLTLIGRDELPRPVPPPTPRSRLSLPLKERLKLAWKYLHHLDDLCQTAPRSVGVRHPSASPWLHYRVEKFSAEETARIHGHSARFCGILGDTQFHAASSVLALHRLRERIGRPSPSYVLPIPVGLRPKGSVEPLFSNQVTMLMFQFLPQHFESIGSAIAAFKKQTEHALRRGLLDSGRHLGELFRFLPPRIYMAMVKQGLRGEIASLFFGDIAVVNPLLTRFLGAPIEDFVHVAAVTPSPGLSVIFYHFRGALRVTVLHSAQVFNESEAGEFALDLRARLLDP